MKLHVPHLGVNTVGDFQELVVRSFLRNQPILQHHDVIGVSNRPQTMGDDQNGSFFADGAGSRKSVQRFLNASLGQRVQCARGFVQQHEGWILQQTSRNRSALLLSTAQLEAAIPDHGFPTFGQGFDEIQELRILGSLDDFLVSCIATTVQQVRVDGIIEHGCSLGNDADGTTQGLLRVSSDVVPVDLDAATQHVVKTEEQARNGCFASACRAHDGRRRAPLHFE
mmetsp:Transcript_6733/g.19718  ORF Transcript_6733/g.19718 Transcript_6733/m.19718 type:complete len:225 (+) Transcript_6733:241-915(+)